MKQTRTLFIKLFLLVALLTSAKAYATEFVSEVKVVGGSSNEVNTLTNTLVAQGWKRINYDLNTNAGGNYIFLFYKTVENTDGEYHDNYITDFYIKSEARDVDDELTYEGRTYHLAPYDGGEVFKH